MFEWIFGFPAVLWGAVLLIAMLVAGVAGRALHRLLLRKPGKGSFDETQEGYVVSGAVTLLAFMIGFTFAIALDRFEDRRHLVGEDARAIEKLYLQTQILGEPHRSRISDLLIRYTDNRIELAQQDTATREQALAEDNRLIREIWTAIIPAFNSIRPFDFSATFVETANQVIELDSARRAARNARIPSEVFGLLFLYAIITAFVFGYVLQGRKGQVSGSILLVLCVMSIMLLIDLNQPVSGAIRESQEPMEKLSKWLHANPPRVFQALSPPEQSPTTD